MKTLQSRYSSLCWRQQQKEPRKKTHWQKPRRKFENCFRIEKWGENIITILLKYSTGCRLTIVEIDVVNNLGSSHVFPVWLWLILVKSESGKEKEQETSRKPVKVIDRFFFRENKKEYGRGAGRGVKVCSAFEFALSAQLFSWYFFSRDLKNIIVISFVDNVNNGLGSFIRECGVDVWWEDAAASFTGSACSRKCTSRWKGRKKITLNSTKEITLGCVFTLFSEPSLFKLCQLS